MGLSRTRAMRSLQVEEKSKIKEEKTVMFMGNGKEKSLDIDQISKALDGLKQGLQNDGANLVVDNISKDRVVVRLILEDHACKECIVDSDVLTAVVEAALREIVPTGAVISLVDPRVKTGE